MTMQHTAESRIAETLNSHWSIGEVTSIRKLGSGLVNDTYVLTTINGSPHKFVFQHLGAVFTSPNVIVDQAVVGQYLRMSGVVIPEPLLTDQGIPFAYCDGRLSKLAVYIEHDEQPKKSIDLEMTESAAILLGKIHRIASKVEYRPKFCIPNFHDIDYYVYRLKECLKNDKFASKTEVVKDSSELLFEKIALCKLQNNLKIQLIHGDPKLDNFLFRSKRAYGMIDLDTLMIAPVLLDIGDAFRSWMQDIRGLFDHGRAEAAYLAYRSENGLPISFEEVCKATKLISLELAVRFLIDYFEETYFKWDSSEYNTAAEHNFARCQYFIKYANSISV